MLFVCMPMWWYDHTFMCSQNAEKWKTIISFRMDIVFVKLISCKVIPLHPGKVNVQYAKP